MTKLKVQIDKAITVTPEGDPHIVNIPELKAALLQIADLIALLDIQIKSNAESKI